MFSLLDAFNHVLSYFNFNLKLKNQIYVILGIFSNSYVVYLAYNFFKHQAYLRAVLYFFVFLLFLYFLIINFFYYFTNKTITWDISRQIEKRLSKQGSPSSHKKKELSANSGQYGHQLVIYDDYQLTNLIVNQGNIIPSFHYIPDGLKKLEKIAEFLINQGLAPRNYEGKKIKRLEKKLML